VVFILLFILSIALNVLLVATDVFKLSVYDIRVSHQYKDLLIYEELFLNERITREKFEKAIEVNNMTMEIFFNGDTINLFSRKLIFKNDILVEIDRDLFIDI